MCGRCSQGKFPQDSSDDVVVLAVAAATKLDVEELWVAFRTADTYPFMKFLYLSVAGSILIFHAYTGCDTVSSFSSREKKTAWDTWKALEEVTSTLLALSTACTCRSNWWTHGLTGMVHYTAVYNRTSSSVNIYEAHHWKSCVWAVPSKPRCELFTIKRRAMNAIPPTRAARRDALGDASARKQHWNALHCASVAVNIVTWDMTIS